MKKNQLIPFTVLMLAIGLACRLSDPSIHDFNDQNMGMLLWLLSPFVLMLVFRTINRDWSLFGLKLQFGKSWIWYLISLILYPILIGLILTVGIWAGSIEQIKSFEVLAQPVLVSLIPLFVKNIFEEFTWRGYLTPQIDKMPISRFKNHLIVGLIWALWHLPFLDLMIRSYAQTSFWLAFPLMFIGIIITAFVYGEIRIRSSTVWTAVVLHTVSNSITNPLINMKVIKFVSGKEYIASPAVDNLAYIVFMCIIAYLLYSLDSKVKAEK